LGKIKRKDKMKDKIVNVRKVVLVSKAMGFDARVTLTYENGVLTLWDDLGKAKAIGQNYLAEDQGETAAAFILGKLLPRFDWQKSTLDPVMEELKTILKLFLEEV